MTIGSPASVDRDAGRLPHPAVLRHVVPGAVRGEITVKIIVADGWLADDLYGLVNDRCGRLQGNLRNRLVLDRHRGWRSSWRCRRVCLLRHGGHLSCRRGVT